MSDYPIQAPETSDFPKAYDPQAIEPRWARAWVERQLFRAENSGDGPAFSIALPPPNITGSIHIGHMLEHTQIDILVRWHRMRGHRTLWLPGMDHAGIATQFVVERQLAKEHVRRQDLGREEFERRVWLWKAESGGVIKEQMIRLGASCDWTRERFTLEPALYRAVLEAFLRLYRDGLIYRGRYMVNWCPRCQTAISDLEVVHIERPGKLWHIRYPIVGAPGATPSPKGTSKQGYVVVATTRPETMLGDTAVAVHPDDERYRDLVGKNVLLPLMDREIPVIADTYVDREFGTGALKITPAHDPNDFEVGKRHNLAEIDVMTDDAHMSAAAGKYVGLDRFAARARIVEDLTELGLLERVEEITHSVGVCDRCKSEVEPRISTQWFCKMTPLAEPAKQAVREGLVEVVPDNQRTILLNWLENIRDWCISRQLWWGHRIPVWHCAACKEMIPALDSRVEIVDGHARAASAPRTCPKCGGSKLTQDSDVLDTWFSSALWPFSTLGWPDDTADLRTFYPTSLLISGYDILFFWDARMLMMGLHLTAGKEPRARIPFRRLYLHSLVRTAEGAKMSKTKGTGVDPLELTQKFGTDALRFMLASMAAPGTDIALSEERVLSYRAFANKIWNAARFIFVNLEKFQAASGAQIEELAAPEIRAEAPHSAGGRISLADRWIFSRLAQTVATVNDALEHFRFHEAAHVVYHFFWGDFCDWYIEWIKPALADADPEAALAAYRNLFAVFDAALRLLHPFMPFLTEELWHRLPQREGARSIAVEAFPEPPAAWKDAEAEEKMTTLQEIIVASRNIQAEMKIDSKRRVTTQVYTATASAAVLIDQNSDVMQRLARSEMQRSVQPLDSTSGSIRSTSQADVRIAHVDAVDVPAEMARLRKEKDRLERDIESKNNRLADRNFRSRAPAEVVRQMETTLADRRGELDKLNERLVRLAKSDGASATT
jgi:valyl-tRNA synthetase